MIYFSFFDFFKAVFAFFTLGGAFAFLRSFVGILPSLSGYIIRCIWYAVCGEGKNIELKRKFDLYGKEANNKHSPNAVFDFLFTLFFGISFIIFSYVFLDGCIRIFSLIFSLLGYYLFINYSQKLCGAAVFLFSVLAFFSAKIVYYVLIVPRCLIRCLIKIIFSSFLSLFLRFFHLIIALKNRIFSCSPLDKREEK